MLILAKLDSGLCLHFESSTVQHNKSINTAIETRRVSQTSHEIEVHGWLLSGGDAVQG